MDFRSLGYVVVKVMLIVIGVGRLATRVLIDWLQVYYHDQFPQNLSACCVFKVIQTLMSGLKADCRE
jgi:hypothetical protein